MSDKVYLGNRLVDMETGEPLPPVSKVILNVDSETCYVAGDDTGTTIEQDCPWATQAMANSVLSRLKGFVYRPFDGSSAILDPTVEMGDGITVSGIYTVLASMGRTFDPLFTATIGAPGSEELEDEYPYETKEQRQTNRELARAYSLISKTSEEIRLEVSGLDDKYTALSVTIDGVTVTDRTGTTKIKGSSIDTSTIKANSITADKLNLTGAITFGDLDEETQIAISDAYTMAMENQLPSYIKSTYIDEVSIQSPTIVAGTFIGNEFDVIAESAGAGGFNLYGKYSNRSVHVFGIAYSGGLTPSVTIDAPAGGNVYWDVAATYVGGDIDMGLNDIYYNAGNGFIASLRELDARVTALEA